MMKRRITCFVGMSLSAGCGLSADERTGGDGGRGDARGITVGTLVHDRLSVPEGDSTDWKQFKLDNQTVKIEVWWDDPGRIKGGLELRDALGGLVADAQLIHVPSRSYEALAITKALSGQFFLRVGANDGACVYTLKITTPELDSSGSDGPDL